MPFCAECGGPVEAHQKFCRKCGAAQPVPLDTESSAATGLESPSGNISDHGAAASDRSSDAPIGPGPLSSTAATATSAPVSGQDAPPSDSSTIIGRLWRGEVSLPATFWGWGFLLNLGFMIALVVVALEAAALYTVLYAVYLTYYAFMVVAIWRSSERFAGARVWASLARIAAMIQLGRILLGLYVQYKYAL